MARFGRDRRTIRTFRSPREEHQDVPVTDLGRVPEQRGLEGRLRVHHEQHVGPDVRGRAGRVVKRSPSACRRTSTGPVSPSANSLSAPMKGATAPLRGSCAASR